MVLEPDRNTDNVLAVGWNNRVGCQDRDLHGKGSLGRSPGCKEKSPLLTFENDLRPSKTRETITERIK